MSELLRKKKEGMVPESQTDHKLFTASASGGKPPAAAGGDSPPIDETFARSFPAGVTNFEQNRNFLKGAPLTAFEGNIQRQTQRGQATGDQFQQQALAGAPSDPFGDPQRQTIESGLQGQANQQQQQAVTDLLSTEYTGPGEMSQDIMGGAIENKATAGGLGSGGQYAGMLGEGTSGERREEAARFVGSEKGRESVGDVQRSADASFRKLSSIESKEQPLVEQQQARAEEHRTGTRGYLQDVQQNVEDRTEVEVDRINAANKTATEMMEKFKESGDVKDLEGAPEGYIDESVFDLAETPAGKMSAEAKVRWDGVWYSDDYAVIGDVPLMRRSVSGQGYESWRREQRFDNPGNQSMRLDPQWLMSPAGQELFSDLMVETSDGGTPILIRYLMGHQWKPGTSSAMYQASTGDVPEESKRGREERREWMPGWDAFTPEQTDAIHRLEMYHTRGMQRHAALVEAGFGRGGEYEVYRPLDGFGYVREWDPLSYAKFVTPLVTKTATIASTMTLTDRKRFNAAAEFLSVAEQAYEEKNPELLTPVMGKLADLIEAEATELEKRADSLDRNQTEWLRMLRRTRRQYRSWRHDENWDTFMEIALTVVSFAAAVLLTPAVIEMIGVAGGVGPLAGAIETGAITVAEVQAAFGGLGVAEVLELLNSSDTIDLSNEELQMLVASAQNTAADMGADQPDYASTVQPAGDYTPYGRRYADQDAVIYDRDDNRGSSIREM